MKEKEVIKLSDNNKYLVAKISKIAKKEYACLLKIGTDADFLVVECDNDGLKVIEDLEEKFSILSIMGFEFEEQNK